MWAEITQRIVEQPNEIVIFITTDHNKCSFRKPKIFVRLYVVCTDTQVEQQNHLFYMLEFLLSKMFVCVFIFLCAVVPILSLQR